MAILHYNWDLNNTETLEVGINVYCIHYLFNFVDNFVSNRTVSHIILLLTIYSNRPVSHIILFFTIYSNRPFSNIAFYRMPFSYTFLFLQWRFLIGSSVTSLAAKSYNNADVIEVQTNTIRGIDVLVNGELVDFEASISNTLSVRGKKLHVYLLWTGRYVTVTVK